MEDKLIIANWKANKTLNETIDWVDKVGKRLFELRRQIILCPSSVFIFPLLEKIKIQNLEDLLILGSQDVSKYTSGAYTGEMPASQLAGFVKFCIVGHSERKKYFGEKDDDIIKKIEELLQFQITPVLCISNLEELDDYFEKETIVAKNSEKIVFVYEPPFAISGGGNYHSDTPENANITAASIKQRVGNNIKTLYGGSVNPENILSFFSQSNIDGGLIGQASLDLDTFIKILESLK